MFVAAEIPVETSLKSQSASNYEQVITSVQYRSLFFNPESEQEQLYQLLFTENVSTIMQFIETEAHSSSTWNEVSEDINDHYTKFIGVKQFRIKAKFNKINKGYKPVITL